MIVAHGAVAPIVIPSSNVFQLHAQDRGLNGVEPAIPSKFFMNVAARAAVIAKAAHVCRHLRIISCDQSGVPVGAEIFCGIETERRGDAHGSCTLLAPSRTDSLRGILDHSQMKFFRELLESIHIGALAVQMNREQRA